MNGTSRHSALRIADATLFREQREERVTLRLPPPSRPDRKPVTEKQPEGGTCIIIQVWPTAPESSDEDTDQAQ